MNPRNLRELALRRKNEIQEFAIRKHFEKIQRQQQKRLYFYKYISLWMQEMITFVRNEMYSRALRGNTEPFNISTPWHLGSDYLDSHLKVSTIVHQYKITNKTIFYDLGFTDEMMPFQKVAKILKNENGIILEDISQSSKGLKLWVRLSLVS
jgi:hypothetical protein